MYELVDVIKIEKGVFHAFVENFENYNDAIYVKNALDKVFNGKKIYKVIEKEES